MKIVILMIVIGAIVLLFGSSFATLLSWFVNGASMVFSTMGLFIDFFARCFDSMFEQPYIISIFSIFLFIFVFCLIVKFLRGLSFGSSVDEYDDFEDYEEYDDNGELVYSSRTSKSNSKHGRKRVKQVLLDNRNNISSSHVRTIEDDKGNRTLITSNRDSFIVRQNGKKHRFHLENTHKRKTKINK